ncbi:MAG: methylmalonyl-CoA mutase family protein [Candidatus Bathyarchaeia archaeon]
MRSEQVTASGIPVHAVYHSQGAGKAHADDELGEPGAFPFTRGIYPAMYRERIWTMRQYSGFGSAEATNERFKYLISQGQTGLSVAFDLPTQLGYDSDSTRAEGEVGRVGVPISTIDNMQALVRGIGLDNVSTSMTINSTAAIMLAMYISVGEIQKVPLDQLRGTTQNDILKEYIARNTYIFPPEQSLRLAIDLIEYCARKMPSWHPISISGYHIRESGANDFIEEIAKFRAARRIWAHIMRDEFHAQNPESMKLRFHTQTSGETLTAQQPLNNVVRVTLQALAAVLGGTQSLHTNSMDEALSLPTEEAVKVALRTQQIIAYESGITHTADPLGGSYYLESLTGDLERAARSEMEVVDKMGGSVKAIQKGYIQAQIRESAFKQQMDVENGTRKTVGVNILKDPEPYRIKIHRIDARSVRKQISTTKAFKRRRSKFRVDRSLRKLETALAGSENVIPLIIAAVRERATTGEVSDIVRKAYGEFHPKTII